MNQAGNALTTSAALILGLCLATGMLGTGYMIAGALESNRAADRYVTVKGLAQREVAADWCIWPIGFNVAGNELTDVQQRVTQYQKTITDFLVSQGFERSGISRSAPRIVDSNAREYYSGNRPPNRYIAESTVTLRTADVSRVRKVMEMSGTLVSAGIAMQDKYRPQYLYTALNAIKPEMIAEATVNARAAADKFAQDSGSRIGGIRKATQGLFSISDRDTYSPDFKKIRVVTTMEYFLIGE